MPDLASMPAPPVAQPPAATDLALLGRPPPATAPAGTPTVGYGTPYGSLAPAILPKSQVTAAGNSQVTATTLTTPIVIVIAATAGGGVYLENIANYSQTILNAAGTPILVYPPKVAGSSINGLATPMTVAAGVEVTFHTLDGVTYFVES